MKVRNLLIAATAALAIVGSASPANAAMAERSATPQSSPDPAGWTRITDDTGTISVAVPPEYSDVTTEPETRMGIGFPRITANAHDTEYVYGVIVSADVFAPNPSDQHCDYDWAHGDCQQHAEGNFTGIRWLGAGCCADPTRWLTFVGNPNAGERVTVSVTLQSIDPNEPDPAVLDQIISSVRVLAEPFPAEWVRSPSELAPPVASAFAVWTYGPFWNVPQLGEEPVRGSGCGADGSIGEVIPDGLWAGTIDVDPNAPQQGMGSPGGWLINLQCVYTGEDAQRVIADGTANIIHDDPNYLIVDNNPRQRAMPNNVQEVRGSFMDLRSDEVCVPGIGATTFGEDRLAFTADEWAQQFSATEQAWIRIADGAVTWIQLGCDDYRYAPGG